MIGLGDKNANFLVYIENRPPLDYYQSLNRISAVKPGEIGNIAEQTGNHWRKIFNVFAKLLFELNDLGFNDWQTLREQWLLQENSKQLLIFSPLTKADLLKHSGKIHLIMGKTYTAKLGFANQLTWLNEYFAVDEKNKVIVCPYFDYRQLSNIKITQLAGLINSLRK